VKLTIHRRLGSKVINALRYTYTPSIRLHGVLLNRLNPSGYYICTTMFNIQQFDVLPTQCIYVFCVDLRTNSDYFTVQH
jgi:hypothetical protein